MIIQQAIYGPLRGHAFLEGSDRLKADVFSSVAWLTDLPQTVPPGVIWEPFFRLVRSGQYLLFIYTRPAEGALREGMVLSRLALLPLEEVEQIGDLRPLAWVLQHEKEANEPLTPIELAEPAVHPPVRPGHLATSIASALEADRATPRVVIGQHGFDDAMMDLWTCVPSEFRQYLTFGLSFGKEDVHDLSVVNTPAELAGRWDPALCVDLSAKREPSPFAAVLLERDAHQSVRNFAKIVDIPLKSPSSVTLSINASKLWESGSTSPDLIQLLRILTELAGSGPAATTIKSQVAQRLAASMNDWTSRDVLVMRNLDLALIPAATGLADALAQWVQRHLGSIEIAQTQAILDSWVSERARPHWLNAICDGFRRAIATGNASSLLEALWTSLIASPNQVHRLMVLVSEAKFPETMLLETIPLAVDQITADELLPAFVSRGWWTLTGKVLARSRSVGDALRAAMIHSPDVTSSKETLMMAALKEADDSEVVTAAVASGDLIAIKIASAACVRMPKLMSMFDWEDKFWFDLLAEASSHNENIASAIPDPWDGLGRTIDAQIVDENVWKVIAHTSLANIIDVRGRDKAWNLIPRAQRDHILTTTSEVWLTRFEEHKVFRNDLEPPLEDAVLAIVGSRGYLMNVLRRNPAVLPAYLNAFPFSNQNEALTLFSDVLHEDFPLSELAAKVLGGIIRSNQWTAVAQEAASVLYRRPDLRPMLGECIEQLSLVNRLWVSFRLNVPVRLGTDEAWAAFESEAIQMYPRGPTDRELWSRSGGRNEDLTHEENGKADWHRCVRDLRSGMAPGVRPLLHTMLEDYTNSDTLRQLIQMKFWR